MRANYVCKVILFYFMQPAVHAAPGSWELCSSPSRGNCRCRCRVGGWRGSAVPLGRGGGGDAGSARSGLARLLAVVAAAKDPGAVCRDVARMNQELSTMS